MIKPMKKLIVYLLILIGLTPLLTGCSYKIVKVDETQKKQVGVDLGAIVENSPTIKYKFVPHIDLKYSLVRTDAVMSYVGVIKGFVAFDNIKDQPKDLWQYYIIEPTNLTDSNFNQIFTVEEIIVIGSLPPKSFGKTELHVKSDSRTDGKLILVDRPGNEFTIDQVAKKVTMADVTGDYTSLITSQIGYNAFMTNFIK